MSRTATVGGQTTAQGNVYQNSVRRAGGDNIATTVRGRVAIVGPCEGEIEPYVPHIFRSDRQLKELLGEGKAYDAARLAFNPSNDSRDEVKGASSVVVVRANNAQQGQLLLQNTVDETLHTLTSKAYGLKASRIGVEREAGTKGALGQKLTISYPGKNDEVADNLGFLPAFVVRYLGAGTAAAMTITDKQLSVSVTDAVADNITLLFSQFKTVGQLVSELNRQTNYEAVAVTPRPGTFLCQDLDKVNSIEILTEDDGTLGIDLTETGTDFSSGSVSGLDAGDVVRVSKVGQEDEFVFVSAVGSPNTFIRGYMDSTPQAWSGATAETFVTVGQTNQAIYEWVNGYSQLLTDVRDLEVVGQPTKLDAPPAITFTAITSGKVLLFKKDDDSKPWEGDDPITADQWQKAYDALKDTPYNAIVDLSESSSVRQGPLKNHVDWRWGKGSQEVLAFASVPANQSKAQVKTARRALNHKRISIYFQEAKRDNDQFVPTWYAPWAAAAIAAGTLVGMRFGTPLLYKSVAAEDFRQHASLDVSNDDIREELILNGINFFYVWDDAIRWARGLSTYTDTDNAEDILLHVQVSLAYTLLDVRRYIKANHFAKSHQDSSASAIKASMRTRLEFLRDSEDAPIIAGSKRINGQIVSVPAFDGIDLDVVSNLANAKYKIVPTGGVEFVSTDSIVGEYSSAA